MRVIFRGERITAHPPVPDQVPVVWKDRLAKPIM